MKSQLQNTGAVAQCWAVCLACCLFFSFFFVFMCSLTALTTLLMCHPGIQTHTHARIEEEPHLLSCHDSSVGKAALVSAFLRRGLVGQNIFMGRCRCHVVFECARAAFSGASLRRKKKANQLLASFKTVFPFFMDAPHVKSPALGFSWCLLFAGTKSQLSIQSPASISAKLDGT